MIPSPGPKGPGLRCRLPTADYLKASMISSSAAFAGRVFD